MNLRRRDCKGTIKIAVLEIYINGNEDAIRPIEFDPQYIGNVTTHAQMCIDVIRQSVPEAEIYLLPPTEEGQQFVIDNDIPIVSMSSSKSFAPWAEKAMSKKAFLITSAGNTGDGGETWSARQDYWCAVGAVTAYDEPAGYSSYGYGKVKTMAQVEYRTVNNHLVDGTSGACPIVAGLLAQWYIWYHSIFDRYPNVMQTYDFIEKNSHDVWRDMDPNKIGYGLFRLPHKFTALKTIVKPGERYTKQYRYIENEAIDWVQVDLLIAPEIKNDRTLVGSNGLTSSLGIDVGYDAAAGESYYIKV